MSNSQHPYDMETRAILARVFESAWEHLQGMHPQTAQPENMQAAREELAKRISETYENGERDPETIKLISLKTFNRWMKEA